METKNRLPSSSTRPAAARTFLGHVLPAPAS